MSFKAREMAALKADYARFTKPEQEVPLTESGEIDLTRVSVMGLVVVQNRILGEMLEQVLALLCTASKPKPARKAPTKRK